MFKVFRISSLLILLFFSSAVFSQNTTETKQAEQEIKTLLKETTKYLNAAKNDKSLQTAKKGLSIALEHNLDNYSARLYNLIGLNFSNLKDYNNADLYYNKSLDYATKIANDTIICWVYNNLGNLYSFSKNDSKTGIQYYLKAVEYSKKISDVEYMYNALNLANTYLDINDLNKAKYFLKEVMPILYNNEKEYEAQFFFNSLSGSYYEEKKQNSRAEKYYLKALDICLAKYPNFLQSNEVEIYKTLSNFYKKNNAYEKAYLYVIKSDSLKEKLFNAERDDNVKILTQEIEKEEVKRKLVKVEAEKVIQQQKLANNKTFIILICIIFLVSLSFLYFQLKTNQFKTRNNEILIERNAELKTAKEKAEEASSVKTQFLSTISHELRTPLYGVIGITNIIEAEYPVLKETQHLKALKFSANYLLALVNDILKIYKIEEQEVVLENTNFNLKEELEIIVNSLQTIAHKTKNNLVLEVDAKMPDFLFGDTIRLSQILINLISNSLKFTKNGTVRIMATVNEQSTSEAVIKFQIIDNGIGIPLAYQGKIFDKFVQIQRAEDDYQGTGLGLSIVKKLVELFKGEINLQSAENVGTTFTIILPFALGVEKAKEIINTPNITSSRYKILIVEDNKINQVVTKTILQKHNFICTIVDDGYEAIELLKTENFDVILMDINMPKINGFETAKIIRKNDLKTPIIAVTAFDKSEIEEKLREAQINDVIVKPFASEKLIQIVYNLISYKANS